MYKKTSTIINALKSYRENESDPVSNAILVGKTDSLTCKHMHELFPGITNDEEKILTDSYKRNFPEELIDLLKLTDGAWLFARNIIIGGLEYDPFKYKNCKLPIGIRYIDCKRSRKTPKEWLYFAEYAARELPDVLVCVDCSISGYKKPVYATLNGSKDIIKSWDSIDDWFSSEFARFEQMYDEGRYDIVDIAGGQVRNLYFEIDLNDDV